MMADGASVEVEIPPKLIDVFTGDADYRAAYGGRGSGKSRTFAKMAAVRGYMWSRAGRAGQIVCGREFQNSLADSSLAEVRAAIQSEKWLSANYDCGDSYIRTRDGRVEFTFVGLRRSLASIKSKTQILLLWVDEAEYVSEHAWEVAIPTVREAGSEVWATWNPERKGSATDKRFRLAPPARCKSTRLNWRDNPWFTPELNRKRLADKERRPDSYAHIWEGEYATVVTGAYWAKELTQAQADGRIGVVAKDPLMSMRAHWDIGGTGSNSDACAIWVDQFVGADIRVLDYYEAVGQPLAAHVQWLREHGYGSAQTVLPHDGVQHDRVYSATYAGALRDAGFDVRVVPNMGAGAALKRVEAARRAFPAIRFNEATTQGGRDAIGAYHEHRDERREIGLGPEHDWSSHAADAFGLMCVDYLSADQRVPDLSALDDYATDY